MKTKTLLAAAALAGLVAGCSTTTKCSKPGTSTCSTAKAKSSCPAKSGCSASNGCASKSGCPAKKPN